MNKLRVSAMIAAIAFVAAPALAQSTASRQPSADDARQLQVVERYAEQLATGTAGSDDRYSLVDKIDSAWNNVSRVYMPLDARATFSGSQSAPFTVMQERMSVLNSSMADDQSARIGAQAVAEWARHLLQKTSSDR